MANTGETDENRSVPKSWAWRLKDKLRHGVEAVEGAAETLHQNVSERLKRAKAAASEHFDPVEKAKGAARERWGHHTDRAARRVDELVRSGGVEFHPGIFSDKVQLRQHFNQAVERFKADRQARQEADAKHHEFQSVRREKIDQVDDKLAARILHITGHDMGYPANGDEASKPRKTDLVRYARAALAIAKGGNVSLTDEETEFLTRVSSRRGLNTEARKMREPFRQEMQEENSAYTAGLKNEKKARRQAVASHSHNIDVLKHNKKHASAHVHEMALRIGIIQRSTSWDVTLSDEQIAWKKNFKAHGEAGVTKMFQEQMQANIDAEKAALRKAKAEHGSPYQRFFGALGMIADEAKVAVTNTAKNADVAVQHGLRRTGSAVVTGFMAGVDHLAAVGAAAAHFVAHAAHGATTKPLVAAVKSAFKS